MHLLLPPFPHSLSLSNIIPSVLFRDAKMEEENLTALHQGTTSTGILNSSMEESFLNYQSNGGEFISEKEMMMMMMSRSRHSDFLADLQHHHQDIMDCQKNAVLWSYLKENAKQAQTLRQENVNLKTVNAELTNRLSLLIKATSDYATFGRLSSGSVVDSVLSGLSRMGLEGNAWNDVVGEGESPSPTSVMDSGRVEGNADRVVVPKSISVRSSGYLKPVQVNKQRVYVRGGKKEEQPVEVEVYNQGMFKTELCNKWQETGACPYGDHCQFAHGIQELRPILRHPRYKTEVCRMVLNGDHCPYGHRCHFRHTLTDQEKLIRSINLRSFKGLLNRQ